MKLSKQTIEILKHCAKINEGIVINPKRFDAETKVEIKAEPTNCIRTISSNKAILFSTFVTEMFPVEVPIFNLESFLADVTPDTDIDWEHPEYIGLKNGRSLTKFARGDPKQIFTPSGVREFQYEEKLFLHVDDFQEIFKKGSNRKPHVVFRGEGKGKPIYIELCDARGGDPVVRSLECKFPRNSNWPFRAVCKFDNLILLKGSYEVEISEVGLTRWTWLNGQATTWVSIEADISKFEKTPDNSQSQEARKAETKQKAA